MTAGGYPDEVDDLLDRLDFATTSELRASIIALTSLLGPGRNRQTRALIATIIDLLEHHADTRELQIDSELHRMLEHP